VYDTCTFDIMVSTIVVCESYRNLRIKSAIPLHIVEVILGERIVIELFSI
jgi:hypothetical protein